MYIIDKWRLIQNRESADLLGSAVMSGTTMELWIADNANDGMVGTRMEQRWW